MKYTKKYTVKEWKCFDWSIQEAICKKYNVILTNYDSPLTKKGIVLKICKTIYSQLNKRNFDKGIGLIQLGVNSISEFGKAFDSGSRKTNSRSNQNDIRKAFWGDNKPIKRIRNDSDLPFYGKKIGFWKD